MHPALVPAALGVVVISGCGQPSRRGRAVSDAPPRYHARTAAAGPSQTTAPDAAAPVAAPDLAAHLRALGPRLPAGFTALAAPPFVVIGDEPPGLLAMRAERTVKWAVDRLKALYFERDPADIIEIWLLKDSASYQANARAIFGADPTTPYGYYSSEHRALIMNIATGGGTLVHEIVHPFMAANFPACPAWFNEGLGSLYEQASERDGRIVGLTNWRLAGLQEAIRADALPSFLQLAGTSDHEFYHADPGTHYAQSRYLCYYLQEQGLLAGFYHAFRAARQEDPTGYETLQRILGEDDMTLFQRRWEQFVLALRFP